MPPLPRGASTSYGPMRVPGCNGACTGPRSWRKGPTAGNRAAGVRLNARPGAGVFPRLEAEVGFSVHDSVRQRLARRGRGLIAKATVYVAVIGLFVAAIAGILHLGSRLDGPREAPP